jgi:hypothetical protein
MVTARKFQWYRRQNDGRWLLMFFCATIVIVYWLSFLYE